MNVVASIQARMNSQRFPGKVLKIIEKKPIIQWQIERLKKSKFINKIVVATTTSKKDDKLYNFCKKKLGVEVYRGSEKDVLKRVTHVVQKYKADLHIECFGDSPLVDPMIIDNFIKFFKKNKYDFVSNTLETTYPPGSEILVYKGSSLIELDNIVPREDPLREHVGFNFTRYKKKFLLKNLKAPKKYFYPNIYLEIDRPIDLKFINIIFSYFTKKNINFFTLGMILSFLKKNKKLSKINSKVLRRWKKLKEINEKKV